MAKETKSIDVKQVVGYLSHSFADTAEKVFGSRAAAVKGTDAYKFQVDFCYVIDEIQRGPTYMLPKEISKANELIARMKKIGQSSD